MIEYKQGNILEEEAEALTNTVNCVGVMGRGIALQFKQAFPGNFRSYRELCKHEGLQPGQMFVFKTEQLTNPRYIINFPTKRHWRGKSRLEDIESGLAALRREIREYQIRSIAIPPLGSGLGGLNWPDVRGRIEAALGDLDGVRVVVYEPNGVPETGQKPRSKSPVMTKGRAVLIGLIERYLKGLLDPFVTLLEVHKLMYFMQEAGQPLNLRYKKAPYGPYAENLRHVLHHVEGYFITGLKDGGDQPDKQIALVPGATRDARSVIEQDPDMQARFNRVSELIEGFETSFGLELLATIHWVMQHDQPSSGDALIKHVYSWNKRKHQFTPRQIALAERVLVDQGWIARSQVTRAG